LPPLTDNCAQNPHFDHDGQPTNNINFISNIDIAAALSEGIDFEGFLTTTTTTMSLEYTTMAVTTNAANTTADTTYAFYPVIAAIPCDACQASSLT